ncbi:hypothetical protein F511_07299 [Dorcoceras hygrometricum]|uniref:Uncharacterized protein n=1 Tax=Dorcoceras hygrometricum TaxID=472368 RepID=A0A2Z7D165_9LAMI|nr:hypothetical protein F511_07299 [Dorcoceras hygrometricum]
MTRRRRRPPVEEPSDSEDTTSAPFMVITKNRRTMCTKTAQSSIDNRVESQPGPVMSNPMDDVDMFITEIPKETLAPTTSMEDRVGTDIFITVDPFDKFGENPGHEIQLGHASPHTDVSHDAQGEKEKSIPYFPEWETIALAERVDQEGCIQRHQGSSPIDKGTTTAEQEGHSMRRMSGPVHNIELNNQ